jgi:hypothetical protein
MKFAGLAILALGATSSAYVVSDPTSDAIAARHPGSGSTFASSIVNAAGIVARHHKGKGKKNARDVLGAREPEPHQ